MRWEDERYVRVYTRDTAELLALTWEARALLWAVLRKCDRAGIIPVGKSGVRGLAGLVGMPPEVVERVLPELLADGCVRGAEASYIVPNFLAAQEAKTTDAQRKRDQRERDRAKVLAEGPASPAAADKVAALERSHASGQLVTPRDERSRPGVTRGHAESHAVTPNRAVPCLAVPKEETLSPAATGTDWRLLKSLWCEVGLGLLPKWVGTSPKRETAARARLREQPNLGWWRRLLERVVATPFLRGENDRGWRANPDWLLKPGVAESVLEGKYDRSPRAVTPRRGPPPDPNQGIVTHEEPELTPAQLAELIRKQEEWLADRETDQP
jgi:hypothetical protein